MAPLKKTFLAPPLSLLVCLSFFAKEDALYYLVTEATMPSILVGEESKDESNGQEYLWLPCRVFWWA